MCSYCLSVYYSVATSTAASATATATSATVASTTVLRHQGRTLWPEIAEFVDLEVGFKRLLDGAGIGPMPKEVWVVGCRVLRRAEMRHRNREWRYENATIAVVVPFAVLVLERAHCSEAEARSSQRVARWLDSELNSLHDSSEGVAAQPKR